MRLPPLLRRPLPPGSGRLAVLGGLLLTFGVVMLWWGPSAKGLSAFVSGLGVYAPLVAVAGSAVLSVVLTPRLVLAVAAGALFGWVLGALYVIIGTTIGAIVAFHVGRWLGRSALANRFGPRLRRFDGWLTRHSIAGVAVARISPLPFGISNYVFGTTSVPRRSFVLGTLLGIIPTTALQAGAGAVLFQ